MVARKLYENKYTRHKIYDSFLQCPDLKGEYFINRG